MTALNRLPTGIPNLDLILGGGLLRGGGYMLQGPPGAGKTTLATQIAVNRAREGGKIIYMTLLSEGHDRMMAHLSTMSFFDPEIVAGHISYISGYLEMEREGVAGLAKLVRKEAERLDAELLILDGLFVVAENVESSHAFRRIVHELQTYAHLADRSLLLLTTSRRDSSSPEFTMVDGWIEFADQRTDGRIVREIEIHKFRGGETIAGRHRYRISNAGFELFPRLESVAGKRPPPAPIETMVSSGIPQLDRMLHGGLDSASSSLLIGPSGTGKTIAALQFAGASTLAEPCLFLGFYESPARLARKAQRVGIDLAALEAVGALHLHWRSPTEILVDEVADWLLSEIRRVGARRLVIDGIAGFKQNLIENDRTGRFLTALVNELRALNVTCLYTSAMTGRGQSPAPEPQGMAELSPIVDNLFAMRLVERNEAMQKVFSIMKVPDRNFDARLTTYTIGSTGITLAS